MTTVIVFYSDCLIPIWKSSREYRTLPLDLFGASASSIILLQLYNLLFFYSFSAIQIHYHYLHWLPVGYRINFKIILITFKDIHGLAPEYLRELLTRKNKCNYNLRSTSEILLQQPRIKTLRMLGDRSFAVAAPALWSNLSKCN